MMTETKVKTNLSFNKSVDMSVNEDYERFKNDMDIMNERYTSLKYQIEGAYDIFLFHNPNFVK